MKPAKEVQFHAFKSDLDNLHVLRRLMPGRSDTYILSEALKALREKLESQPAREPLNESAEQSIKDLFGE